MCLSWVLALVLLLFPMLIFWILRIPHFPISVGLRLLKTIMKVLETCLSHHTSSKWIEGKGIEDQSRLCYLPMYLMKTLIYNIQENSGPMPTILFLNGGIALMMEARTYRLQIYCLLGHPILGSFIQIRAAMEGLVGSRSLLKALLMPQKHY